MSSAFNNKHHQAHHLKREPNENNTGIFYPPSPSPSPLPTLKVNKDSHVIKKQPSPSPRHPVIIYTHTPKIIHTKPKDFMALVQKLTGMSRSDEDSSVNPTMTTDREGKSINPSVSDLNVDRKLIRNRSVRGGGGGNNIYHRSYSGTGAGAGNGKGMIFNNAMISEDSEASSVITTDHENMSEFLQMNSSLQYSTVAIPPQTHPLQPPPPSMYDARGINYGGYLPTFPLLPSATPTDNLLCANQPFVNFDDPLFFAPNMRSSFSSSSSSGFDGLTEIRDSLLEK